MAKTCEEGLLLRVVGKETGLCFLQEMCGPSDQGKAEHTVILENFIRDILAKTHEFDLKIAKNYLQIHKEDYKKC